MHTRCVLLADVVKSTDIPDRQGFDRELHETLRSFDGAFDESTVGGFDTMKGFHEFGGVLWDFGQTYRVIRRIQEGLHPVEIRYAISVDEVDVNPDAIDIKRMDGPALHAGTELLENLKRSSRRFGIHYPSGSVNRLLEDVVNLVLFTKEGWTEKQLEIVRTYRDSETMTEAAETLDLSVQRVSTALQATYGTQILDVETRIEREFEQMGSEEVNANIRGD